MRDNVLQSLDQILICKIMKFASCVSDMMQKYLFIDEIGFLQITILFELNCIFKEKKMPRKFYLKLQSYDVLKNLVFEDFLWMVIHLLPDRHVSIP